MSSHDILSTPASGAPEATPVTPPATQRAAIGTSARLPDAHHADGVHQAGIVLDRVGMSGIEVAVRVRGIDGSLLLTPAKANAYVSLDQTSARGIHMSRLFLSLQSLLSTRELYLPLIEELLNAFLASHVTTSTSASVLISFDLLLQRRALMSDHLAWRTYPVRMGGELIQGRLSVHLGATVAYSSTCPSSAALARQLGQERFRSDFAGQTRVDASEVSEWLGDERATGGIPHSQRSLARVDISPRLLDQSLSLIELIDLTEQALGTPVQSAVKREDEKEFARLNAKNLMFCEDAGRRLATAFNLEERIADYRIEATHIESLHPHDAVCMVTKGIENGFRA